MTIGCNIWMICLILIWFFYGLSRMLQFSQFVWALRSSVWDVFNNFLLIDATDRSRISSDQKRFFIALSLYPLSFFANTPFKRSIHNEISITIRIIKWSAGTINGSAGTIKRSAGSINWSAGNLKWSAGTIKVGWKN